MIVADTNLLAYLLLAGEHAAAAQRVRERDAAWAAPPLWRSELRSVLVGRLRRGEIGQPEADAVMAVPLVTSDREMLRAFPLIAMAPERFAPNS